MPYNSFQQLIDSRISWTKDHPRIVFEFEITEDVQSGLKFVKQPRGSWHCRKQPKKEIRRQEHIRLCSRQLTVR